MRAAVRCCLLLFVLGVLWAQDKVFICPMDPDVRSNKEGVCSRCGMKLRAGIPEPIEFPVDLNVTPRAVKRGEKTELEFTIRDPQNSRQQVGVRRSCKTLAHVWGEIVCGATTRARNGLVF